MLLNLLSIRIDYNRGSNFPKGGGGGVAYLSIATFSSRKGLGRGERRKSKRRAEGQRKEVRKTCSLKKHKE
jgi:hypothetical protein